MHPEQLFTAIKQQASAIDQLMAEDLENIHCPHLPQVLKHAIFNGGKRIRPLLTLLAAELAGNTDIDRVNLSRLAIVFEYLHAASLLHDDVIDHADQRRGAPTANTVWDNSIAILAGDFLHARAMTLAGTAGGVDCLTIIGKATADMVEAEFLQLDTALASRSEAENYFNVIAGKTAALIAAASETGILFAGGTEEQCEAMRLYGNNLGLAFQIVDDLLDYLGDPDRTGKAVGNDFTEGKMTLPLLHALAAADQESRQQVDALLAATPEARLQAFGLARDFIQRHQGFEHARKRAEELIAEALTGLAIFTDCPAKEILTGLAGYVLSRDK